MTRSMIRVAALWPALLFALAAGFTGGFATGAAFPAAWIGLGAVLITALAGAGELADPLRLGTGRWLLAALLAGVAASAAVAEVPRAGRVGLVLLPAFLLLPAATARLLRDEAARRAGVVAWGAATAALAAWALIDLAERGGGRAAAPLGHHNLLAVTLAVALPIAALGWRSGGAARATAVAALLLGAGALAATRSLTGIVAAGAAAWVASRRAGRARDLLLGVALLGLGLAVPRIEAIVRGADSSAAARAVYLLAAWDGALDRPWLGWGLGASPWTLAAFLAPRPGVNPPGELVGDPHSTPVALAYEIGLPSLALALAVAVAFARARRRGAPPGDPALAAAGQAALAAGAVALAGGAWLHLPAFPTLLALAAGFALAGEGGSPGAGRPARATVALYVAAAAALLTPAALAHRAYERARSEADPSLRQARLAEAVRHDPSFPLYRARLGWGDTQAAGAPPGGDWRELRRAAAQARGVGPLWLRTAAVASAAGARPAAVHAAMQAMAFDPLSATAPFLLHQMEPRDVDCAARALLAEPRLAAATVWRGREGERRAALARAARWPGIDEGWQRELVAQAVAAAPGDGVEADLVTRIDGQPALAASLFLFRRSPWPSEVARIRLDRDAAQGIRVPRATELASSQASAFPARRCAPR
jgi:hypothetical protein